VCGIAGLIGNEPVRADPVRRMVERMRHRGPDDSGVHAPAPTVVMGSARLSILDLSPAGRQPMSNEDGRVWVVFNGEIFNFRDLREELASRGHRFRSGTDTEVIVHAYEEWGADCLHRLRGMFAFAIYDGRPGGPDGCGGVVFLARDALGIKPLYYASAGGGLLFASEVRALLASGLVSRDLSVAGLTSYLLWGSTAEPVTLIEGIRSLPPGHRMFVRVASDGPRQGSPEAYWQLTPSGGASGIDTRADAVGRLRDLLQERVAAHLIADVPVGVFLSSGVDSTSVAALAARVQGGLTTVTVAFPEEAGYSEAAVAQETARRLGTDHREVPLTGAQMLSRLDEAVAALDQPSSDGTNTYFVSWGARQAGLKVALSGLGGDELFGGYRTFAWLPRLERIMTLAGRAPMGMRRAAAAVMEGFAARRGVEAAYKLAGAVGHSNGWRPNDSLASYLLARAVFVPSRIRRLRNGTDGDGWEPWIGRLEQLERLARRQGAFGRVSTMELGAYLVNTLLRDTDGMSMAHSLEVRVPFVDREVVEFVRGLPDSWRRAHGPDGLRAKGLLVDAVGNLLPPGIHRLPKRTFTLPWDRWLRGPLRRKVEEGIEAIPDPLRPFLDSGEVRAVWRDFLAGRTGWARPWSLYVLNDWVRRAAHPAT